MRSDARSLYWVPLAGVFTLLAATPVFMLWTETGVVTGPEHNDERERVRQAQGRELMPETLEEPGTTTKLAEEGNQRLQPTREELRSIVDDEDADHPLRAAAARALTKANAEDTLADAQALALNGEPAVARGAVRGVAASGHPDAAAFLAALLHDKTVPESVRMEAAIGLASLKTPEAYQTLLRATYSDIDDHPTEPVLQEVVQGLAREHFADTNDFLHNLLDHPDIEIETKIAALEALMGAKGNEVIPTLLKYATHPDPDLREAAIWAIAGRDDRERIYSDLTDLLANETSPWVRTNLYDALRTQQAVDVEPFWNQVTSETDLGARLAGFNFIAGHLSPEAILRFETEIVPELHETAVHDSSLSNRVSAIAALSRAGESKAATAALHSLLEDPLIDLETRHAAAVALH